MNEPARGRDPLSRVYWGGGMWRNRDQDAQLTQFTPEQRGHWENIQLKEKKEKPPGTKEKTGCKMKEGRTTKQREAPSSQCDDFPLFGA